MEGPLNITGGGLTVNGVISATSFNGSMSARNISSGIFGAEKGEGNFSFPDYLGVGNTNPNYDLDVSGNINFTGTLYQNGDIFTSSKWSNNGLNIYFNTGNVGIGLTNPDTKLDVGGIIKGLNATFTGLAGSGNAFVMADDTGNLYSTSTDAILPEGTVSLPSGSSGSTLRHDGDAWISNTFLYNNGTAIGIGTTEPGSLLTVANNSWLSARNSADTGIINMFNQIEVGAPLLIGPLEFAQDSGMVSFLDMPVSSAAPIGTPEGYSMKIDDPLFRIRWFWRHTEFRSWHWH